MNIDISVLKDTDIFMCSRDGVTYKTTGNVVSSMLAPEISGLDWPEAVVDLFGSIDGEQMAYGQTVAHPNGKLYVIPDAVYEAGEYDWNYPGWLNNAPIIEIDPATDTETKLIPIGGNTEQDFYTRANHFKYGVVGADEKIYLIPWAHPDIYTFDPENFDQLNYRSWFPEDAGFEYDYEGQLHAAPYVLGGVLGPDGYIYISPGRLNNVYRFDTNPGASDWSMENLGDVSNAAGADEYSPKFVRGRVAPNGKIYMFPNGCSEILEIDPATGALNLFGSSELNGEKYFTAAVVGLNGKLYSRNSTKFVELDPDTKEITITEIDWPAGGYLAAAPSGKLYQLPAYGDNTKAVEIDVETMTAVELDTPSHSGDNYMPSSFTDPAISSNGKIYAGPVTGRKVISIDLGIEADEDGTWPVKNFNGDTYDSQSLYFK